MLVISPLRWKQRFCRSGESVDGVAAGFGSESLGEIGVE
jgi:hypothetical protein